ncbi:hypothetical protein PG985_005612 [Apiospora marii]|uniref:uncharacterized protein n=1 Tax=Apiospora marii TaxID=335849 RepID=UPI00312D53F4
MLVTFPPEILGLIVGNLGKKDLKSLSLVSKITNAAVANLVWQSITIEPYSEDELHRIETTGLQLHCFELATQLHLRSSFGYVTQNRCPHLYEEGEAGLRPASEDEDDNEDGGHDQSHIDRLARKAESVLQQFGKERLRSFRWLRLGSICKVVSLSWKAPHPRNLGALSVAIRSNAESLQTLDLDFLDWSSMAKDLGYESDGDDSTSHFLASVLKSHQHSPRPFFPKMRTLSLSQVPLGKAMAVATNFDTLTSLTLRNCPGWHRFVKGALKHNYPINLKRLEIQHSDSLSVGDGESVLRAFLDSFEGLEELYISELGPQDSIELWQHVVRHQASLRNLVYHQRIVGIDEESPFFEEEHDLDDLAIFGRQMRLIKEDCSQNPLADLDLECLGLSCIPERLKHILRPFVSRGSLKLLHIRQSGSDLAHYPSFAFKPCRYNAEGLICGAVSGIEKSETGESQSTRSLSYMTDSGTESDAEEISPALDMQRVDSRTARLLSHLRKEFVQFLAWVFGSQGVASLQTVVFGDFAHGRFSRESMMLCRGTDEGMDFRIYGDYDAEFRRIFDEYRDVLEACPVDPFLGKEVWR